MEIKQTVLSRIKTKCLNPASLKYHHKYAFYKNKHTEVTIFMEVNFPPSKTINHALPFPHPYTTLTTNF